MLRKLTFIAAISACTALGLSAASAQTATTGEVVYPYPPGYVYTNRAPVVVAPVPATRYVPRTVYVPQTIVNEPYVASGTAYAVPQTRVVVRPVDCGLYHYWNGAACIDARTTPPVLVRAD